MKTKNALLILTLILITFKIKAYVTIEFPGWGVLAEKSSDIIVARCVNSQDPFNSWKNGHQIDFRGLIDSNYEIVSVLKGRTNTGTVTITSEYRPQQGHYYLLFQDYIDGSYAGVEDYRVIPLGEPFSTRSITGKPLEEQIKILFRCSARYLDNEIQRDQQKKNLLKEALN